eukprot:459980_1
MVLWLGYLLLITNTYVHIVLSLEECAGFVCKWTIQDYELDLTQFQLMGINLTASDSNGNTFSFTPCNNLLPGTFSQWQYMAVEVDNQKNRNYLAEYDPNIAPVIRFDVNQEPIWSFQYNSNFSVEYICHYNPNWSSFMEISQIFEVYPGSFLLRITSHFVCDNVTVSDELSRNQCFWSSYGQVLDLRPLYGKEIIYDNYRLYVCQNSWYRTDGRCSSSGTGCCAMYGYTSSGGYLYANGIYDSSVQPWYDIFSDIWKFEYKASAYGSSDTFTLQWVCDPQVTSYRVLSQSQYSLRISSIYACAEEKKCIFSDGDDEDNILDLTHLYGDQIRYISDDVTYSFEYTICGNDILCNGTTSVMAIRWNINETICDPFLAIWDGFNGYDLSYDDDLAQWKFAYFNGEQCLGPRNTEFDIYWRCNQSVPNWKVTNVESINECHYSMYIDSFYAC